MGTERLNVSLVCVDCKSRNYQTTKKRGGKPLEMKKFCKQCEKHTVHRESK